MKKLQEIYVFLLLCSAVLCESKTITVPCSDFCICDTYQELRRATCQNKRLISVETDMAPEVQILDLSFNQISEFDDRCFKKQNILDIKLLNVSHNKISHIHFNAFEGLTNLKSLDLSFNALRYITKSWFKCLASLEELYLKRNLLRTINEQPRIESKSLRVLDLSDCGMIHLKNDIFGKIPSIEVLDLSGNLIVELNPEVLIPLKNLSVLNILNNNNLNCQSKSVGDLKEYRRIYGFALKHSCKNHHNLKKSHMFERMVAQSETHSDLEKNTWIFQVSHENNVSKIIESCSNGSSKYEKFTGTYSMQGFDGLLMQIVTISPIAVLFGLFGYGLFIGIIVGCFCKCNCKKQKRMRNYNDLELPDGVATINDNLSQHSVNKLYRYVDYNDALGSPPTSKNSRTGEIKELYNRQMSDDKLVKRKSFVNQLRRSRSIGSKPRAECETLMRSEFNLSNSTPITTRKGLDTFSIAD